MAWLIGLAFAAGLGWLWWSGYGIGRIAAWLALTVVGFVWYSLATEAQRRGVPVEEQSALPYLAIVGAAWAAAWAPGWLRRRGP